MSGVFLSLRGLVEKLEGLAAELPEEPSLEDLARYVEARADAAETLSRLDPAGLTASEKRGLSTRLRKVLERDQALVFALFALREDVGKRLSELPTARRAVRGYGDASVGGRLLRSA
jgi:hypothetical protein